MINNYYRPETLENAMELLARPGVVTVPLGGGSTFALDDRDSLDVVDLQALELDFISSKGKMFELGATVRLQALLDAPALLPAFKKAIRHQATYNLRQVATVAGILVSADGRSPFATVMLALAAELTALPGERNIDLGNFLPLRADRDRRSLITKVIIPNNVTLAYEYVSRTPADLPIVGAAVAQWPSGRTRVALCGYGSVPLLAMDGPESNGAERAAQNAYHEAGDQWASAGYRSEMAATLVKRCLDFGSKE